MHTALFLILLLAAAGVRGDEWAVQVVPGANPDDVARRHRCVNAGKIGTLSIYRFHCEAAHGPGEHGGHHPTLAVESEVSWLEAQLPRRRFTRSVGAAAATAQLLERARRGSEWTTPTNSLYGTEWQLAELRVERTWKRGVTGRGVTIAIVDDGLDEAHPDLAPHYRSEISWDYNGNDGDPTPDPADSHGTAAAGVAAAARDTLCTVGIAPDASLAGIRLIAAPATDAQEAEALTHRYNDVAVYSSSWGPLDDGRRLEAPGRLAMMALEDGVTRGRNGRGVVYVWAAGNGNEAQDRVDFDGYASSRFTIAVAAMASDGVAAWYSEPGAAVLVTAPSSGAALSISSAAPHRHCTTTFGGTSAAAPQVAGVVALILEARPALTWRDVQHVLIETARPVDTTSPGWTRNGVGRAVHYRYGFGLVDADAAVSLAETHLLVSPVSSATSGKRWGSVALEPAQGMLGSAAIVLVHLDATLRVEHVELTVTIDHPHRNALAITLVSPAGTASVLAEPHGGAGANYSNWKFTTVRAWGEAAGGVWRLVVEDRGDAPSPGRVLEWTLTVYGA